MLLKDKVVLVTGSTTGIGEAIARRAVQEGAYVMMHGRSESRAKKLVDRLPSEYVHYCLGDLLEAGVTEHLVEQTVAHFGRLDILINNAALSPRNNINSITTEEFDWIFDFWTSRNMKHDNTM